MNLTISAIADYLSIIGFMITIATFFVVRNNKKEIRELNKRNLFINRLPDNLKELKNTSLLLSRLISDINTNRKQILREISKLAPVLKSIKKSLKKHDLEYFNLLKDEVDKHKNMYYSINEVSWIRKQFKLYYILDGQYIDKIYRSIATLITDIENLDKDFKKDLLR